MVITHNMTAQNTNRQMGIVTTSQSKNMEKLSSGYKINRAADDAAGLTISEKMRFQIRGLNKASNNAQDGISLIQTAEGALNETHSVLQRMRELSVQASNDTNTVADRKALQKEIDSLLKEVDRIADQTTYNTMPLLNGSMSTTAVSEDSINQFMSWLNGSWLNDAGSLIESTTGWTLSPATSLNITFSNNGGNAVASMSGAFLSNTLTLNMNTQYMSDGMTYNGSDGPTVGGIAADRVIAHEMTHGYMFENVSSAADVPLWFVEGLAEGVHGASTVRYSRYESGELTDFNAVNQAIQAFDFNNPSNNSVNSNYTVGYLATSYLATSLGTTDFKGLLDDLSDGAGFETLVSNATGTNFNTFMNTFKTTMNDAYTAGTFKDTLDAIAGIDLTDGLSDRINGTDTSSSDAVTNSGSASAVTSGSANMTIGSTSIAVNWNNDTTHIGSIKLQVGALEGQVMDLSIDSVTTAALGLDVVDVTTFDDAQTAIDSVDKAIEKVSSIRSNLGAFQNRLEHTIANLDNTSENISAGESRIRDADMAEVMVQYSRDQILMQATQSMLSQANQSTQGVLSIIQ